MESITVRGTAQVSFSTDLDVDIDDLVSNYLDNYLSGEYFTGVGVGEFELQDVEIDEVEVN